MKINWSLRKQSKTTLISLIGLTALFVNQVASLFGVDYSETVQKVVLIATTLVSMLVAIGVVNDPTTKGLDDSEYSMAKEELTDTKAIIDKSDNHAGPSVYGGNKHV